MYIVQMKKNREQKFEKVSNFMYWGTDNCKRTGRGNINAASC